MSVRPLNADASSVAAVAPAGRYSPLGALFGRGWSAVDWMAVRNSPFARLRPDHAALTGCRGCVARSLLLMSRLLGVLLRGSLPAHAVRRGRRGLRGSGGLADSLVTLIVDAPKEQEDDCRRTDRCCGNLPPGRMSLARLRRRYQRQVSERIVLMRIQGGILQRTVPAPSGPGRF